MRADMVFAAEDRRWTNIMHTDLRTDDRQAPNFWTCSKMSLGFLIALSMLGAVPAWSQSGRTNSNNAAAVLRLQVRVAPVAMVPRQSPEQTRHAEAIAYDLHPQVLRMDL